MKELKNPELIDKIWNIISIYERDILKNAKSKGAFFTNKEVCFDIIDSLIGDYSKQEIKEKQFLEPANGLGMFVFSLLHYLEKEKGFDNDELLYFINHNLTTVEIDANDNHSYLLLLKLFFSEKGEGLDKKLSSNAVLDSFFNISKNNRKDYPVFDIILGNPPYGVSMPNEKEMMKNAYSSIDSSKKHSFSNDSYGLFFLKGLLLLKNGGRLGFITPDSFFNIKTHFSLRKTLIPHLKEIVICPKNVFMNPFTKQSPGITSCITILEKDNVGKDVKGANVDDIITIYDNSNNPYSVGYSVIRGEESSIKIKKSVLGGMFLSPISVLLSDNVLLSVLLDKSLLKVKDVFNSAMGIKTADNKYFVRESKENFLKKSSNNVGGESNDIGVFYKGTSSEPQSFFSSPVGYIDIGLLKAEKRKNTNIPQDIFLSQNIFKIGVPEIGHKGEICAFAYREGYVSNSIWIYLLKDGADEISGVSDVSDELLYYMALFNSSFYKKLSMVYSNGIRIEKHTIDSLPILNLPDGTVSKIVQISKKIWNKKTSIAEGMKDIDFLVNEGVSLLY